MSRYLFAIVLDMGVLFGWQIIFPPEQANISNIESSNSKNNIELNLPSEKLSTITEPCPDKRVAISNNKIEGSINLCGAKIDEIYLKDFKTSTKDNSDYVKFFTPSNGKNGYWVESGWKSPKNIRYNLPGPDTLWSLEDGQTLTPNNPVTLSWDNGEGLLFKQKISIDGN